MVRARSSPKQSFTLQKTVASLPHTPGVYIYADVSGTVIYIGKAIDLKKRVSQYFARDDAVGAKTRILVPQIHSIRHIETISELDALLLEAKLIYMHQPKYNVIAKDDKSPVYVKITLSETLPRIEYIRKPGTVRTEGPAPGRDEIFGPFQSSKTLRSLMSTIRRIIPYCTQRKRDGNPCFYTHIGLCAPCPSEIVKMQDGNEKASAVSTYRRNMFLIRDIMAGKSKNVLANLEKEMSQASGDERFEDAVVIRNQIQALYALVTRRADPMRYIKDDLTIADMTSHELESLASRLRKYYPDISNLNRIECIDISTILGEFATGSLVVLTEGRTDTGQYRRFKIRTVKFQNDFAMISEVTRRRFKHPEWGMPDLFIVDGGKGQVRAAMDALHENAVTIPVIGLAKRMEEIIVPTGDGMVQLKLPLTDPAVHILQRIRDEAHRFAVRYHRLLRSQDLKLDTIT